MTVFKGTVSVISRDPPCKEGNAPLTTVPFKPLIVHQVKKNAVVKSLENHWNSCKTQCTLSDSVNFTQLIA